MSGAMPEGNRTWRTAVSIAAMLSVAVHTAAAAPPPHPLDVWVKRSPAPGAPVSPRMGYESACAWDSARRQVIRYGGHNQGGGGEQGSEVWTLDPATWRWTLKEPNTSPPGVCCNAQNLFDPVRGRYLRFPRFSGSHGWQWWREIYLNDSSVWSYDPASNLWRNLRPLPAPVLAPLRCAAWDSDAEVALVFGGEGSREGTLIYDPYLNEWRVLEPPLEPEGRSAGTLAYDSARRLHVLFGAQFTDDPQTWVYDLPRNTWTPRRPSPSPPTRENDAVLASDTANRIVLALVKSGSSTDDSSQHVVHTWAYDTGADRWTRMNPAVEPDPAGNRARQLVFAPELNLFILENCTARPREQQVWTYRYADVKTPVPIPPPAAAPTRPPIVEDAVVSVISPVRVELTWTPPAVTKVPAYHVERAAVEVLTEDQLTRLKRKVAPLAEPSVGAIRRIGPFTRLTAAPIADASFADTQVDLSKPGPAEGEPVCEWTPHKDEFDAAGRSYRFAVFAYRIRAVGADGAESGPSPAFFTIPAPPQWLFSREEGGTCHLKWAAGLEKGLRGHRVYRMDGRWEKDSISRLTADPVGVTTYSDAGAGEATRRYYVVAVDALGQEGFPSSPVWHRREWRTHYEPFIGEWHQ